MQKRIKNGYNSFDGKHRNEHVGGAVPTLALRRFVIGSKISRHRLMRSEVEPYYSTATPSYT